jgi:hypothetical protein
MIHTTRPRKRIKTRFSNPYNSCSPSLMISCYIEGISPGADQAVGMAGAPARTSRIGIRLLWRTEVMVLP